MSETAAIGIILGSIGIFFVLVIGYYVIQAIAYWRIFTRAGEAGWKSLIPIYNLYTQYKICWNTTMFWITFLGTIVGAFIYNMDGAISLLGAVISLAASIVNLISWNKLAKAFGHGIGFTLGLILLNPIFMLILGLGNDTYQGPQ